LRIFVSHPHLALRFGLGLTPQEFSPRSWLGRRKNTYSIIEAGAFDGTDTLRIAKYQQESLVYAFEPVPQLFTKVVKNLEGIANAIPINVALVGPRGPKMVTIRTFGTNEIPHGSSSVLEPTLHKSSFPNIEFGATIEVEATTLNDWISNEHIRVPVALYLDLQGLELDVLLGLEEKICDVNVIHVEVAVTTLYAGGCKWDDLRSFLFMNGFKEVSIRVLTLNGNAIYVRKECLTTSQRARLFFSRVTRSFERASWAVSPLLEQLKAR
jgi:FkbM family methyltransferase